MKKSITQTVIDAYAHFFERHRLLVLTFVILATLVSSYGVTQLTFNDDIAQLFLTGGDADPSKPADIRTRTDRAVLVMLEAEELFTPEALGVLQRSSEGLKEVEGVVGVVSLYDLRTPKRVGRRRTFTRVIPPPDADIERIEKAKQQAMDHPMARQQLISKDGKETLMLLELDSKLTTTAQLRSLLDTVKGVLASATEGTGVTATVTGFPTIRTKLAEATIRDELTFNIAGPVVAVVIALVIFRRMASVVIVVGGAVLGVVWTFGLLGLFGEAINPVNAVVAPLALTIGLTDSVHMLMHIREEGAKGTNRVHAVVSSIPRVGFPSALTSVTSAVGFVSLGIAKLDVLARFGICSAIAVVVAFVSVMTIVPLLACSFLGDHIQVAKKTPPAGHASRTKWHTHLAAFIVDHRVAMLVVSFLVTGAALYLGVQVRTDPRIANGLPSTGDTRRDFLKVEEEFGGSLPLVTTVRWSADTQPTPDQVYSAIADAHHALEGKSITGPPLSLVNLYQSMAQKDRNPKSLFQQVSKVPEEQRKIFFDPDARQALVVARCQDAGGHPVDDLLTSIEADFAQLEAKHPGFQFRITETMLHGIRNATMIVADLIKSLLLAVPLTIGVLMLALKSFRAGVIALLPNIFPMAALAATMVIFRQSITLTGAAVFVMCFGIAVDDTIHTITAFNRNFEAGQSVRDAIVNAYRDLGDAILSTTAILIGGLGVVILGQSYFTRMFGVMFCIGLAWAVIGDLVILPAILACFPHKRGKQTEPAAEPAG